MNNQGKNNTLKQYLTLYGIYFAFALLIILMAILSPAFLKPTNILNILRQTSINGIIAVGMTLVILTGGIDLSVGSVLALSAVIGSSAFFITDGFKKNAESNEQQLLSNKSDMSDISKILYLEIIDATFSIDGVLGAFAFTTSVPLIILGNGLGAIVVRQLTMGNIENIKKYVFLKNGAMYSILCLGMVMILEGFKVEIPEYITPLVTILIIIFFFLKSKKHASN